MKTFNLIKWLWTDSREKQSPQRFARYAAILVMLLTLGVGQMWAGAGYWGSDAVVLKYWLGGDDIEYKHSSSSTTKDLGTVTSFYLKHWEFRTWKDGSGNICDYGRMYYRIYLTSASAPAYSYWSQDGTSWDGNNQYHYKDCNNNILSGLGGGRYYLEYYFVAQGNTSSSSGCGTNITSNTFKIQFTIDPVVTFKANSGTGSDYTQTVTYNTNTALTANTFSKTGYDFAGWATSSDGSVVYANQANIKRTSNITLYAKWTAHNYTTSNNIKHADGTTAGQYNVTYDNTSISYTTAPSKTGYNIVGLYKQAAFTNKIVNSDRSLVASTSYTTSGSKWNQTSAPNLYVKWEVKTYSITLHDNNGGSNNGSATATYDGGLSSLSAPTRSSYHVVGYYKEPELTNLIADSEGNLEASTSYTDASGNWTNDGDVTLYAKWEADASYYTLTYGAGSSPYNNGSVSAVNASTSAAISSGASLLSGTSVTFTATPTNSHYKLKGWYSDAACSSAIAGAGTTNPYTKAINTTQSVYAGFEIKTCTITLDRNGGTSGSTSVTATHGSTLPSFTAHGRSGYTLNGYYTETSGGTKIINADGSLVASTSYANGSKQWNSDVTSLTLHAQWTEKLTTVTINANPAESGTFTVGGVAFSEGGTITAGVATSRTVVATAANDYAFSSWSVTGNATGTSSTNTYTLKGNGSGSTGTLTANFTLIPCKLYKVSAAKNGSTTDKGAMSYDATEHAYYKDITTDASPYYFRFYYNNSAQYCTDWSSKAGGDAYTSGKQITANDTKVDCDQSVGGWGDKPAMYYSGASGTTIRIWFDYQNKKVWITADKDKQYVLRGANADDPSAAHGMPGWDATTSYFVGLASGNTGTVSCSLNAAEWYHLKVYDMYNSYWYGATGSEEELHDGVYGTMGSGNDFYFGATIADSYTFTLDKSSGMKIKVDYPVSYQLNYSIGSVAGTEGSISSSPSTASGSYIPSGNTVTLTAPAAKTGYTWKGWYTNAAGTEGKIADVDRAITVTMNADKTLYACYSINNHAITHSASSHGTYTIKVGSAAAVSTNTTSDYGKTITLAATPATGYHFGSWSAYKTGTPATTVTVSSNQFTMPDYPVTVGATFTPNTYTITLHEQGATTHGSPSDGGTISVTYDATTNLSKITAVPERTGYTFGGYYDTEECDGTWIIKTDTYFNWDGTYLNSTTGKWQYDGNLNLYAKWTANQYTVTLDVDEANKGTIAGATTSQDIYYDDLTVTVPNRPTAANGYALDGYYTEQLGAGTKVINGDGTWIASVEGYTDASKHWIHAGDVTLYAYYKKAEITAITFDAAVVEASGAVSFAVTVSPTPTGTTKLCFTVLHSNNNPLAEQPTITYNGGTGKYSFTAPAASGTYKVEAVLRTGSSCDGGTELDTEVANFQVAGLHTVTVRYKCGDEVIKAASSLEGIRPLDWSDEITAPDIIGYSFTGWSAGDGVSLTDDNGTTTKTSTTEADIKIKAIYDGYLTANYSKKRIIYFNNTLGWDNVYVYFYKNGTYWNATYGTGCNGIYQYTDYPFSEGLYGQMLPVEEGSKIYYFDAEAAGVNASYQTVVFTELDQHTYDWFAKTGDVKNKVIKRDDYYSTKLPMYVPLAVQTPDSKNGNKADYYWQGYWMNYPENTGYTLKIYNQKATDGAVELKSIPFEFTADKTMPMELDVDLEAGKTYGFKIYRNDGLNTGAGSFYGNTGTMTANAEGWDMKTTASSNAGLQTTAAGSYKFVLNFYEISSDYQYRVSVTYPVAVGDYRIVYTDGATWSGSAHGASWNHPSGVIAKNSSATETKKDTVSFFWSYGSSPAIGYQTCSSLSAGSASWSAKTAISVSGYSSVLTKTGVYNFIFEQPAGGASISLVKVEPYTGNYYIRTDVANSKWDNYRTDPDHMMTYSDYSIEHGGYSHYYCHWVQTDDRKNVKFCIANDYSPCISDTLTRETASGEWANIGYYIESNGDVTRPANVRFMWNQSTNVISRAYIDGAQEVGSYFLEILSSDDKIRDPDDHSDLNQISFNDIENWVYEQNIQAQPGARIKLRSNWGTENTITQYFKGSSSATEQLIGGSGSAWYDIRVIYDFKTNRLIASYIPVDENIESEKAIEADIMFIREHQGDIAQLTFGENGKISKIETAYGVMRFNKWTLNNLSKTYPHDPLSSPASIYERSLFYISFPFRVKLSDVIGFGTYGVHWAVQRYDGAARAQKGHFQENGSFWKWMNRNTEYLEPNQGYLLAVDLDLLGRYSDIWGPTDGGGLERRSERLEIYFPSYGTMPDITNASVTCSIPEHPCTINWYEEGKVPGPDTGDPRTSYNRTIFDSHWNVMSVPTYVNTNAIAFANTSWVTTFGGPNFLYTWNANDNTIAATSATGFEYHAMHSYMVQYGGNVTWTARSGSPAGIVASKTYAEQPSKVEFRLELQQDSAMIDRTFVALSNDEETSAGFRFGEDLTKEFNANKANIYTFIADEATAAGNTLPMSDQTTIVPVGVDIKTNGDYTFAIPDGTSGVGVTLIDTENNIRTSLSALSYTVNLTAGTHDGRFLLEIAPIQQTPTDIDLINGENGENGVRKMLIDQQMYIIRDGKIYDARGARVQ